MTVSLRSRCSVATDRKRHWVFYPIPKGLAPWTLVISGTAAAAFAGLVAEDLFPSDDRAPEWNLPRLTVLAVAVLIAIWATWSLSTHRQRRGTLYYLRLQNETSVDLHRGTVNRAVKDYLGFRSVGGWCDPRTATVDLRRTVAGMSEELERAMNDDADDSGFDIAPNVVFPAALALGFEWIPPRNVTLREFNPRGDKPAVQSFQWRLGCANASGMGCSNGRRRHRATHFDISRTAGYRLRARTTSTTEATAARSVWLEYWLSNTDWTVEPMTSPHKASADVVRIVHVENPMTPGAIGPYTLLSYGPRSNLPKSGLTVRQVAEAAAYWLRKTLEDFPNATVFVAGGMPKTVSFAMGYLMTQPPMRGAAAHPWRRIVPMGHFLHEPKPELRPTWVRPDQRSPDELIKELETT